jgi:polyphosphate kinase
LKRLLQAPFTMHSSMLEFIEQETENARSQKPARIFAKINSLIEPQVIQALY